MTEGISPFLRKKMTLFRDKSLNAMHLYELGAAKKLKHLDCNEFQNGAEPKHRSYKPTYVADDVNPVVTNKHRHMVTTIELGTYVRAFKSGTYRGLRIESNTRSIKI